MRVCGANHPANEEDLACERLRIDDTQKLKSWTTRVRQLCAARSGRKLGESASQQRKIGPGCVVLKRDLQDSVSRCRDWRSTDEVLSAASDGACDGDHFVFPLVPIER